MNLRTLDLIWLQSPLKLCCCLPMQSVCTGGEYHPAASVHLRQMHSSCQHHHGHVFSFFLLEVQVALEIKIESILLLNITPLEKANTKRGKSSCSGLLLCFFLKNILNAYYPASLVALYFSLQLDIAYAEVALLRKPTIWQLASQYSIYDILVKNKVAYSCTHLIKRKS